MSSSDFTKVPMINMKQTGENIKKLRKAKGMKVNDLKDVMGFATPQAIYKWQQGATLPSLDNLVILSRVFGVPIDEIIVVDAA